MQLRTKLLLSSVMLAIGTIAYGDTIPSNYEAFNYQATVLPTAATPAWVKTQTGGTEAIIDGTILDGDTYTGNTGKLLYYYRYCNTGTTLDRSAENGYVVELKVAIPQCENSIVTRNRADAGFCLSIRDTSGGVDATGQTYALGFDATANGGHIGVSSGVSSALQSYSTLSNYNSSVLNTFTIVRIGDHLTVYLNGNSTPVLDVANLTTAASAGRSLLQMGDQGSSYDVHFDLEYIKGGSIIPEPATLTLACCGLVATMLSSRRRK